MAVQDPAPSRQRFVRLVRAAAVLTIVIAALAVAMVARGQSERHIQPLIAIALAIGLTVLLGTALMTLISLRNRNGSEAEAVAPAIERDHS